MNAKALARYLYANAPGFAALRFAAKDLMAAQFPKPEFYGVTSLSIGSGLIVDIGANRGQSIAAFKTLASLSTIVAFEPEPTSADRLKQLYRTDKSVTIHACALGAEASLITFFVPSYGRWNCDGMAATDRQTATEWLRDPGRMYRFDERKLRVTEHAVKCVTLDSFRLSPSLLKLHAQGAEFDILKGGIQTLRQHEPALMCAFPAPATSDFLAGLGYRPYTYNRSRFTPGVARRPVTFTWYLTEIHARRLPIGPA